MFYYEDCLEEQFLVTSNQTAFSLQLLWEYTTLMIVNKCAFEGLAASYNLTHNGDVGGNSRLFMEAKRLREGWFLYALLEMSQRYGVAGPVSQSPMLLMSRFAFASLFSIESFQHDGQSTPAPYLVVRILSYLMVE